MKTIRPSLVTLTVLGIICATAIATAETIAQPSSSPVQSDRSLPASAKELTAMRCLVCHGNPQAGQRRLAPPFMMVKRHYQSLNKEKFVKTVSSWVNKPRANKSRMPGAINHFGLMPKFDYPEDEVKTIAEYVYHTDFPMVGGHGMGAAQGQAGENTSCCKECDPATDSIGIKGKAKACGDCESKQGAAVKGKGKGKGTAKACDDCESKQGAAVKGKGKGKGKGAAKACDDCESKQGAAVKGKGKGKGKGKEHASRDRG